MLFSLQSTWPRYVGWVRVLLATVAPAAAYRFLPSAGAPLFRGVMAIYLVYAVVIALRARNHTGMVGLLALFADTVFFLLVASYGADGLLWLASVFYVFLLGEALAFYTTVEVVVIVAVCTVFCAVLPFGVLALERTVVVAGVLAAAFAVNKRQQAVEIERLGGRLLEAEKAAEKARELERVRIASDFHDGPLQSFISLQMRLEILRKLMERDLNAGMSDLKQLQALAQSQVRDLRTFLHSMRPVDVDGANLVATARRAAESFQKESGIPVTFLGPTRRWVCLRR